MFKMKSLTWLVALLGVGEAMELPNRFDRPEERRSLSGGMQKRVPKADAAFPAQYFQQKVSRTFS